MSKERSGHTHTEQKGLRLYFDWKKGLFKIVYFIDMH